VDYKDGEDDIKDERVAKMDTIRQSDIDVDNQTQDRQLDGKDKQMAMSMTVKSRVR